MDVIAISILLAVVIIILKISIGKKNKNKKELSLKETVKKTFPNYKIIEKNQTIMICEINHRNEPDELVFIRIKSNSSKNIKKSGRMLICDYPKKPTAEEMLRDFKGHL